MTTMLDRLASKARDVNTYSPNAGPFEALPDHRKEKWRETVRAILTEMRNLPPEIIALGRAELRPDGLPLDEGDVRQCVRVMLDAITAGAEKPPQR